MYLDSHDRLLDMWNGLLFNSYGHDGGFSTAPYVCTFRHVCNLFMIKWCSKYGSVFVFMYIESRMR